MVKLAAIVALDLVRSTFHVVWEILTPTDYTDEAIIAIDPPVDARSHLLLLVVAITVTPGTAVIDTDEETGRLYLHLLHAEAADEVTAHVHRVAELACRAFPVSTSPRAKAVAP
jgi:multisubunit Na+/H+ antiporter MnhE subunit